MPNVTVTTQRKIGITFKPIEGARIFSIDSAGNKQLKGHTDAAGKLSFSLNAGDKITAEKPKFIPTPPREVPPFDVRPFNFIKDKDGCYYIIKRLRMLIKNGELDKAKQLVERVTDTYSNYAEIPQLKEFAELVKKLA